MSHETGKELVHKIHKLQSSLRNLQEYKGEVFCKLQTIIRETKFVKHKQDPEQEGVDRVLHALEAIEDTARDIERILVVPPGGAEQEQESPAGYYKVNLRTILNFGILDVESETVSVSVVFKGRLYDILHELIKKYIDDLANDMPAEFRGYVNRKKLEEKLYGKHVGKNRLNSHITRMRSMLYENGLTDTCFIKSLNDFVRLNIDSYDVTVTRISTE